MNRPDRGDVLERHLRRAVLADRDARVRAGERERRAADRGHADEVVGAREERGERRRERPSSRRPAAPPQRRPAAARRCTSRSSGRDAPSRTSPRTSSSRPRRRARRRRGAQRRARRAPRRTPYVSRPSRRARSAGARASRRERSLPSARPPASATSTRTSRGPAELGDRRFRVVERLAVPAVPVLDRRDALALHRSARRRPWACPVVATAVANASSIASRSCPSIAIAFQPNASARAT